MIFAIIGLIITIFIYAAAKIFYRYTKIAVFTPLLVAPVLLVLLLFIFQIPYDSYDNGTKILTILLQPATVAFAIPLYKYYPVLKKHLKEILFSVIFGSIVSIVSAATIALLLDFNASLIHSIMPYSITTPIAMDVSKSIGGIPTITAVFVIVTGIMGSIIGPFMIKMFRFKSEIAHGVLLGTSSHGCGTSKALEMSAKTGAVSSVCMILAAIISICASPLLAFVF
ncbi:LrgB family protein [Bacillaceae bacterium Marseille-Q3522]|nr:LrgB family protein [Bacillaceae bacterium Marseille-Q3522]